jgi:hypothetical protein
MEPWLTAGTMGKILGFGTTEILALINLFFRVQYPVL